MKELQDSFFEKAVSFAVNLPHWCEAKDLPETEAAVRFAEDGLYIRMCCKEKDPKRVRVLRCACGHSRRRSEKVLLSKGM